MKRMIVKAALVAPVLTSFMVTDSSAALAETAPEKVVLLEDTYWDSGYTSFGYKSASMLGAAAHFATLSGAWRVDPRLAVGVTGDVLVGSLETKSSGDGEEPGKVSLYLVGLLAEYEIFSQDVFSVVGGASVGWGEASTRRKGAEDPAATGVVSTKDEVLSDSMTYVSPEVSGLVHVSHRIDLGVSVGYRMTNGADFDQYSDADLRSATAGLFVRGNF